MLTEASTCSKAQPVCCSDNSAGTDNPFLTFPFPFRSLQAAVCVGWGAHWRFFHSAGSLVSLGCLPISL